MNLYHVRATIDYLAYTKDAQDAESELVEAIFDAEPNDMTEIIVTEFKPGDRLPDGWEPDSEVYGDTLMTVADCLAKAAFDSKQAELPLGVHEEESE